MEPTTRRSRARRLTVLALTFGLALGACGGTSSSANPGGGAGGILNQVVQSGTLRVATLTGNAPFESLDSSGQLVGYDIDIANLLATQMKVKAVFTQTDTAGRVTSLQSGKADIVVGSFTRNLERSKVISFSDPINLEAVVLLVKADRSDLTQISDLNKAGKGVAAAAGTTQVAAVQQALPLATVVQVPGMADELSAVAGGKADAAGVANTQVGEWMAQNPGQYKVLPGSLTAPQEDSIGLPAGDVAWQNYVNLFVHQIASDGTMYTLYQKWFGAGTTPGPFAAPPPGA